MPRTKEMIPTEVREQMCRDYKRGLSLKELSAVYGSSVTMVHSIVRNSCEKKRGRPCGTDKRVVEAMVIDYQNGLSVKRLAKKYHFAENSVYIVLRKNGDVVKQNSRELIKQIQADLNCGELSQSDIAKKYGVSRQYVFQVKQKMGGNEDGRI